MALIQLPGIDVGANAEHLMTQGLHYGDAVGPADAVEPPAADRPARQIRSFKELRSPETSRKDCSDIASAGSLTFGGKSYSITYDSGKGILEVSRDADYDSRVLRFRMAAKEFFTHRLARGTLKSQSEQIRSVLLSRIDKAQGAKTATIKSNLHFGLNVIGYRRDKDHGAREVTPVLPESIDRIKLPESAQSAGSREDISSLVMTSAALLYGDTMNDSASVLRGGKRSFISDLVFERQLTNSVVDPSGEAPSDVLLDVLIRVVENFVAHDADINGLKGDDGRGKERAEYAAHAFRVTRLCMADMMLEALSEAVGENGKLDPGKAVTFLGSLGIGADPGAKGGGDGVPAQASGMFGLLSRGQGSRATQQDDSRVLTFARVLARSEPGFELLMQCMPDADAKGKQVDGVSYRDALRTFLQASDEMARARKRGADEAPASYLIRVAESTSGLLTAGTRAQKANNATVAERVLLASANLLKATGGAESDQNVLDDRQKADLFAWWQGLRDEGKGSSLAKAQDEMRKVVDLIMETDSKALVPSSGALSRMQYAVTRRGGAREAFRFGATPSTATNRVTANRFSQEAGSAMASMRDGYEALATRADAGITPAQRIQFLTTAAILSYWLGRTENGGRREFLTLDRNSRDAIAADYSGSVAGLGDAEKQAFRKALDSHRGFTLEQLAKQAREQQKNIKWTGEEREKFEQAATSIAKAFELRNDKTNDVIGRKQFVESTNHFLEDTAFGNGVEFGTRGGVGVAAQMSVAIPGVGVVASVSPGVQAGYAAADTFRIGSQSSGGGQMQLSHTSEKQVASHMSVSVGGGLSGGVVTASGGVSVGVGADGVLRNTNGIVFRHRMDRDESDNATEGWREGLKSDFAFFADIAEKESQSTASGRKSPQQIWMEYACQFFARDASVGLTKAEEVAVRLVGSAGVGASLHFPGMPVGAVGDASNSLAGALGPQIAAATIVTPVNTAITRETGRLTRTTASTAIRSQVVIDAGIGVLAPLSTQMSLTSEAAPSLPMIGTEVNVVDAGVTVAYTLSEERGVVRADSFRDCRFRDPVSLVQALRAEEGCWKGLLGEDAFEHDLKEIMSVERRFNRTYLIRERISDVARKELSALRALHASIRARNPNDPRLAEIDNDCRNVLVHPHAWLPSGYHVVEGVVTTHQLGVSSIVSAFSEVSNTSERDIKGQRIPAVRRVVVNPQPVAQTVVQPVHDAIIDPVVPVVPVAPATPVPAIPVEPFKIPVMDPRRSKRYSMAVGVGIDIDRKGKGNADFSREQSLVGSFGGHASSLPTDALAALKLAAGRSIKEDTEQDVRFWRNSLRVVTSEA